MEGDLLRALLSRLEPTDHAQLRHAFHGDTDAAEGILGDAGTEAGAAGGATAAVAGDGSVLPAAGGQAEFDGP